MERSGLLADLRQSLRAWRTAPIIPLVNLIFVPLYGFAITGPAVTSLFVMVVLLPAFAVFGGLFAAERVAYVRAWHGRGTSPATMGALALAYATRMLGLGFCYNLVWFGLLLPAALLTRGPGANAISTVITGALFLVAPAWVTFGTKYWGKAMSLSLLTMRRAWPASAPYLLLAVTMVAFSVRVDNVALRYTLAAGFALWSSLARGATTALYLRHHRIDPDQLPYQAIQALEPWENGQPLASSPTVEQLEPAV